jgi:hypothetical protein
MDAIGDIFSGGGSSAADANAAGLQANAAATADIAKTQAASAKEYLDFQKQQYADLKPLAESLGKAQLETMEQQSAIAKENQAIAQDQTNYNNETYRPLEKSIVEDANSYSTEAKQEELARKGMADVATAYDAQRKQALATLSSFGINPNSNRFAAINAQLSQGQAADSAGVATNARSNAEQLGYARKMDAASLGRGLASNASTSYGVALNAGNSSVNSGTAAMGTMSAPGTAMGASYGNYSTQLGNSANSYYGAGNLNASGYKITSAAESAGSAGLGSLAGQFMSSGVGQAAMKAGGTALMSMFADGGEVHEGAGPVRGIGGPVDDSINAKLSNGEYVLPADTVKRIGIKKLDKLVASTHTPAATQRRQAIGTRG